MTKMLSTAQIIWYWYVSFSFSVITWAFINAKIYFLPRIFSFSYPLFRLLVALADAKIPHNEAATLSPLSLQISPSVFRLL